MNRNEFVTRAVRYLLFGLLGLMLVLVGNKVSASTDCKTCPGKGICGGENDCSKYLKK